MSITPINYPPESKPSLAEAAGNIVNITTGAIIPGILGGLVAGVVGVLLATAMITAPVALIAFKIILMATVISAIFNMFVAWHMLKTQ